MTQQNEQTWWDSLRHFGLLLSPGEVKQLEADFPAPPLSEYLFLGYPLDCRSHYI